MMSSSRGKFDFKNAKNHQKSQKFNGLSFSEKLRQDFSSYISHFCHQDVYVDKIPGGFDHSSKSWRVEASKMRSKLLKKWTNFLKYDLQKGWKLWD